MRGTGAGVCRRWPEQRCVGVGGRSDGHDIDELSFLDREGAMLTSRVVLDGLGRVLVRGSLLVVGLVLFVASPAAGEERVALVIGNAAYAHALPLANPVHDATAVGEALRRLGFDVTEVVDADIRTLADALAAFQSRSATADKAVVFYAGHGIEVGGENYLIPVDAELARERDVSWQAVPLNQVLADTEGARLRLVILDACRNNPFLQQAATRTLARGLARVAVPPAGAADEMLVALSTAPGNVAETARDETVRSRRRCCSIWRRRAWTWGCCSGE